MEPGSERDGGRAAAALRAHAAGHEPDGQRIRTLLAHRLSGGGSSGAAVERPANLPARSRRGLNGPLAAMVAVACAVLAVVLVATGRPDGPGPTLPSASPLVVAAPTAGTAADPPPADDTDPVPLASTAGSPSAAASRSGPDGAEAGPSGTGPSGTGRSGAARPGAAGRGAEGTRIRRQVGDVTLVLGVRPVAPGRSLDLRPDRSWVVVAGPDAGDQPHRASGGTTVGPVRPLGPQAVTAAGPFTVRWADGETSGTTSTWAETASDLPSLGAPTGGLGGGLGGGLQVPIRSLPSGRTVVLLAGTVDGPGRISVVLRGTGGITRPVTVTLPGGDGVRAAVVDLTVVTGTSSDRGPATDLVIDVCAGSDRSRSGLAAAAVL